jgi:hypothetical protein
MDATGTEEESWAKDRKVEVIIDDWSTPNPCTPGGALEPPGAVSAAAGAREPQ